MADPAHGGAPGASPARPGNSSFGTVLLTGATGFIGQHIQHALLDQGWHLRALVRSDSPRVTHIDPRVEIVDGSLHDSAALSRGVVGTTAVINCAGAVRGNCFEDFEAANVDGVRKLCEALKKLKNTPALLHLSSLAATEPGLSDYAKSKYEGERVLKSFDTLDWCVIRPPAVYGPGDKELRATLAWVRRGIVPVAGADRTQRLSLLHVDDLSRAVLSWLAGPEASRHKSYAIDDGTQDGYDWVAIAEAVSKRKPRFISLSTQALTTFASYNERLAALTGRKVMLSQGKVRELTHSRWVASDNSAFTESCGWTPQISLAEGASGLFES